MGQAIKDLDLAYDSDSTASNSIIDGYIGKEIESKKQIPTISTIAFTSSSNIQIGDRVVYNGPVTINQDVNKLEIDGQKNVVKKKKCEFLKDNRKSILIVAGVAMTLILTISLTLSFMWDTINSSLTPPQLFELNIISRQ